MRRPVQRAELSRPPTPSTGRAPAIRTRQSRPQSATVHVGRPGIEHAWTITSNGKTQDAIDLAAKVIADWEGWLAGKGLL